MDLKELRLRKMLRSFLFQFIRKILETEDAREMLISTLRGPLRSSSLATAINFDCDDSPYTELRSSRPQSQTAPYEDVVIITGRFRSGSTLLWNLFRHIDGVTAYYEPFNERQWFDSELRGNHVDHTHKNVSDYWREYEGFDFLKTLYRKQWTHKNLFMDATFWAPEMKKYIELLIENAPGRPVLQCNRIDFRLPWIRHHFPGAKIIHLYRHPRDQWCSFLRKPECVPHNTTMAQFASYDGFYLRTWATDLKYHFPFLDEKDVSHPYQTFYYLWKLSYLFGSTYSDMSICFEFLMHDLEKYLGNLFNFLSIEDFDMAKLTCIVNQPSIGKWKHYADDEWFVRHESDCETVLNNFFSAQRKTC